MPLATMNWKRGLLRLWAVAAVLWVCVAFYANDSLQFELLEKLGAVLPGATFHHHRVIFMDNDGNDISEKFYLSTWTVLYRFANLAFIPPLLLLALGYIGLWVGRGFRR